MGKRGYGHGGRARHRKLRHDWKREDTAPNYIEYERNCRKLFISQIFSDDDELCDRAYKQCASKRYFDGRSDALAVGLRYGQQAYHCPHCHGWHLTSRAIDPDSRQQRAWRQAERARMDCGISDGDIERHIWLLPFEDEPVEERMAIVAAAAARIDHDMSRRIECRRGTRTYVGVA